MSRSNMLLKNTIVWYITLMSTRNVAARIYFLGIIQNIVTIIIITFRDIKDKTFEYTCEISVA